MSYGEINWTSNPKLGDKISAFKGGAWVWDGCAWTHTCCPTPSCDIRENGLKVGVTGLSTIDEYYLDLSATQVFCLEYQGNDVWKSPDIPAGGTANIFVKFEDGQWVLMIEGTSLHLVIATLSGSEPVGSWKPNNISVTEVVSECGCVSTICLNLKNAIYNQKSEILATMFPLIEYIPGSLNGNVLGYAYPLSTEVGIFIFNGEWYLIFRETELLAVLPGVYPGLPVGTGWVPISASSEAIIETVEGSCPCEPIVNGITLVMELDVAGEPVTIYINFKFSAETLYAAPIPGMNLSYSGGVWSFNFPGALGDANIANLSGESPLGTEWIITGYLPDKEFPPILSIVTSCGTDPDNYGCLVYLTKGSPQSIVRIDFIKVVTETRVFYMSADNYQIVPTGPNTWGIRRSSVTIATATGPTNVPPFGLTWTILDPDIDQLGFDRNCKIPK